MVTFNLFHGGPWSSWNGRDFDLEARLDMVIRELRHLAPDVVALQEASRGRRRGVVARRLAEALGFHYVFEPATTRLSPLGLLNHLIVAALDFAEGPAVLSRFPIAGSEVATLPRCRHALDPRILLRADVATPWGPLAVFTTHTSADPCQLDHVSAVVRAHARARPVILTGDFNLVETHEAVAALNGAVGFLDAFRAAHPDRPGPTVYQRPGASVPTASRRVDYIFVAGMPDPIRVVCGSRVVLDQPGRTPDGRMVWPSDHYGVLADVDPFGIQCAP